MKKYFLQFSLGVILGVAHFLSYWYMADILLKYNIWELYISFVLPLIISIFFSSITEKTKKGKLISGAVLFFTMRICEKITAFIFLFDVLSNFN